jgi:hypothetical protein
MCLLLLDFSISSLSISPLNFQAWTRQSFLWCFCFHEGMTNLFKTIIFMLPSRSLLIVWACLQRIDRRQECVCLKQILNVKMKVQELHSKCWQMI